MATRAQWAAGSRLGDETLYPGDMNGVDRRSLIRLLVSSNPKRKGRRSRERFALYRDGMTVAEYIAEVAEFGDKEQVALDDLAYDLDRLYIRVDEPALGRNWSVADAKAKLSEILRLARAGEPQTIGAEEPCVVISAAQFDQLWQPQHLGRFLVESAPREFELELPPRNNDRGDPFADFWPPR